MNPRNGHGNYRVKDHALGAMASLEINGHSRFLTFKCKEPLLTQSRHLTQPLKLCDRTPSITWD